jgi:hypothetical protein
MYTWFVLMLTAESAWARYTAQKAQRRRDELLVVKARAQTRTNTAGFIQ